MTKVSEYRMTYYSGGGTAYDGGIWLIKQTDKTVTFENIDKPFFEPNCPYKMVIRKNKERSHCLRDWGDGSFTVYPFQSGVPHVFEPILLATKLVGIEE